MPVLLRIFAQIMCQRGKFGGLLNYKILVFFVVKLRNKIYPSLEGAFLRH
jgi:hypothetical protein